MNTGQIAARAAPALRTTPRCKPDPAVREAQRRLLLAQAGHGAAVQGVLALLVAAVFWPRAAHVGLVAWGGFLLVAMGVRVATSVCYEARDSASRTRLFAIHRACIVAAGLGWGVECSVLGRGAPFEMNVFLTFVLAGLTAGGIATIGSNCRVYTGFMLGIALPIMADFLLRASELYAVMAAMIAVYCLALQAAVRSFEDNLLSALCLSHANARLVASLRRSNDALLESNDRLSYQALHDDLTGLCNRREFERRLATAIASCAEGQTGHAVCYFDLDQFKVVNDVCGHAGGDELLRQLARVLQRTVRRMDTLARLGGDEFAVLVECCSVEQAQHAARAVRTALEGFTFVWDGKQLKVGASIGLVPIDEATLTVSAVLAAADAACFTAKEQGRDRIHVYHPSDEEIARRHTEMAWVERINRAIAEDRLSLVYQEIAPAVPAHTTGRHFELLVRLRDVDGRIISPGVFLPAAERFHIASRIDRWVLQQALTWLRGLGADARRIELCSINLSGQSLTNSEFLDFTLAELAVPGTRPETLCFEITETTAIANLAAAQRFIGEVKARGCRVALDDFGSGLSSFGYLRSLAVDFLKIDGIFVKDLLTDPINLAMVRSINDIGQVLGKRTVAEFVEDDATRRKLAELGVDYVQGYGIARPRPLDELFSLS